MGCATNTIKFTSIAVNVVLAILAIFSIGLIAYYPGALREELAIAAYIACSLIVLFSFVGCFAAIRESICLTTACAIFLLVLAIIQISLTCVFLSDRNSDNALRALESWDMKDLDLIQAQHKCCGKTSAQDYVLLMKPIPASCYANEEASEADGLYLDGCKLKLLNYYETETVWISIISWLLVAFEILGFLVSLYLIINYRNTQRRMQF